MGGAGPSSGGPGGVPGRWRQTFGDEFDGPSLDTSRWRPNRSGGANLDGAFNSEREGAFFSPANVGLRDSCAVLSIRPDVRSVAGVRYSHSSGTISTQGHFELCDPCYVEARIRVPRGDGLLPAMWTVPDDAWPPEIDVFEFYDTNAESRPSFNYHFANGGQSGVTAYGDPGVDYRDSWHTYGLLRSGGCLTPYLDGVGHADVSAVGADRIPQFLILNLAVYAGRHPTADAEMLIDWVRAWRQY